MEPIELKLLLEEKLDKNLSPRVFLDSMRVIDEESRKTAAYNDPRYIPFYYWLGEAVKPKSVIEIGFRLGLCSGNFFRGCKTAEKFFAFQEISTEYYSPRIGRRNVKDHFKGKFDIHVGFLTDDRVDMILSVNVWDLAIINEEVGYDKHRSYLEVIWSKLNTDGLIIMDYVSRHKPAKEAFLDFCKYVNREPVVVNTRYGIGIIRK
jgi:predicted O-methyltransferase YrrM